MRYSKIYLKRKSTKRNRKLSHKKIKKTRRNRNYRGGSTVTLPVVVDKNNIAYSCTPIPTK
jgi:hypothetical protein